MTPATVERLLELNRTFYQTVATNFDATRGGLPLGWRQLKPWIQPPSGRPLRVLDVGCGNGRFARLLQEWGIDAAYTGIDADEQLLALATEHTQELASIDTTFRSADFTEAAWFDQANLAAGSFDLVVCFAALHHVPSRVLRQQLVGDLAQLAAANGTILLSHWQFLSSRRFVRKQIAWQTIGLAETEVEPGDALLPWQRGTYAVRYVHQTELPEAEDLATATSLTLVDHFYADGKEGNLNLYTIIEHNHTEHNRIENNRIENNKESYEYP